MPDHPRSRGVYYSEIGLETADQGSSPLARGLLYTSDREALTRGIIPARAGFTGAPVRSAKWSGDHPRSRGVYLATLTLICIPRGSSPLARGLPIFFRRMTSRGRIIPARAGFTAPPPRPRTSDQERGSSPLARGLPTGASRAESGRRIIPARAGFTIHLTCIVHSCEDHPRSRGVYRGRAGSGRSRLGSSPLARGLPRRRQQHGGRAGIIPARAGFTDRVRGPVCSCWDHPRSRGVYGRTCNIFAATGGSSPLARGLHLRILGILTNPYSTRPLLPSLPT